DGHELQAHAPAHQLLARVRVACTHQVDETKDQDDQNRYRCQDRQEIKNLIQLLCSDLARRTLGSQDVPSAWETRRFLIGRTSRVYYDTACHTRIAVFPRHALGCGIRGDGRAFWSSRTAGGG